MGIRFYCPNNHKLNVKTHLAGKRGVCPECGAKVDIPLESEPRREAPKAVEPKQEQSVPSTDSVVWYVSTPNGERFGPVDEHGFQNWIREGRVQQDDLVWQDGWPEWKTAQEVLAARQPSTPAGAVEPPPARVGLEPPETRQAENDSSASAVKIEVDRPVPQTKRKSTTIVICLVVACLLLIGPLVYVFTL